MAKSNRWKDSILLRFNGNWADEMDVDGFVLMGKKDWDEYKEQVISQFGPNERSVSIGTNEEIIFSDADEYLNEITEIEVSEDQADFVVSIFGSTQFGTFPWLEFDDDD